MATDVAPRTQQLGGARGIRAVPGRPATTPTDSGDAVAREPQAHGPDTHRASEQAAAAIAEAADTSTAARQPAARRLGGTQRAAVLLIAVGADPSGEVLKHLPEHLIERLTEEIVRLGRVPNEVTDSVLQEFFDLVLANGDRVMGGLEQARKLLTPAVGSQRANELIDRIIARLRQTPFWFLHDVDASQLVNFVQNEHPQTIALILAHLPSGLGARVLTELPPALQSEVARRVATLEPATPDVVRGVEQLLSRKMAAATGKSSIPMGGVDHVVDMLNAVDRNTERNIMDELDENYPELADEIKRNMFKFEDISFLGEREVQRIVREVDTRDLTMALRGASDELKQKFFRNMSTRAAANLQEEIEFLGPTRITTIEEAQQRIIAAIRRLEQAEEIVIGRGGADEMV